MARCSALVLLLLALELAHSFDADGGRRPPMPSRPGVGVERMTSSAVGVQQPVQQAGIKGEVSKWYARYQAFVSGAAKVSSVISMGCGAWLFVTTPFALLGSTFGLRLHDIVLCAYLCMMGMLMFAMEVPLGALQRVIKQYFLFVFTRPGRAAFVVLVAAIASIVKSVGVVTKALLLFNAGLNFYILNSQDRRFAASDQQAIQAFGAVGEEIQKSASDVLSMGKYLGIGKFFGSSAPPSPPPASSYDSRFEGMGSSSSFEPTDNAWPGPSDA